MSSRGLLAVLSLIVIGLLGYRACGGPLGTEVSLPAQLIGVWTTQTPSHADRHLEIRANEVVFGQGEAGNQKHLIRGVRRRSDDQGQPIYVIRYLASVSPASEATLELRFNDPFLVIVTQPEIRWLRAR